MYGIIKEGKCYVLHKVKSCGNFGSDYSACIDRFETECGYKTFRELNHKGGNILGSFVDIAREKLDFNTCRPRGPRDGVVDPYNRDYIINPTDIYLTDRKIIKPNRYDEVCKDCFPNGIKAENDG